MNFSYFNKMTSFTNTNINIGNHKNSKFTKNRPEYLWPCIYGLNAINKCDLNSPRCW